MQHQRRLLISEKLCPILPNQTSQQHHRDGEAIVVKDRVKVGKTDLLNGQPHVEDICSTAEAIDHLPSIAAHIEIQIIRTANHRTPNDHGKAHPHQPGDARVKETLLTQSNQDYCGVLKDGKHGNRQVLDSLTTRPNHQDEQEGDGKPLKGSTKSSLLYLYKSCILPIAAV